MLKLVQICASQNDLFGLDRDGIVYHYNFGTNHWRQLGQGRPDVAAGPTGDEQSAAGPGEVPDGHGRPQLTGRSHRD